MFRLFFFGLIICTAFVLAGALVPALSGDVFGILVWLPFVAWVSWSAYQAKIQGVQRSDIFSYSLQRFRTFSIALYSVLLLFALYTFLRIAAIESEARVSIQQGEFDRAASLLEQAVAIRDKSTPDAEKSKRARDNLEGLKEICALLTASDEPHDADEPAGSLDEQTERLCDEGKCAEAEPVAKRAIATSLRKHGVEHPGTARSVNNLALLYKKQGKYAEAEPLYKRALTIDEQALGPDHPSTVLIRGNLKAMQEERAAKAKGE